MTDPTCPHAEIARLQKDLQFARAEAAAHRDAFEAELEGSRELRLIMGAREKETMWDVVERVVKERDEARAGAHRFQMDAAMLAFLIEAAHTNVARGVSAAEQIEELYRSMLIVAVKNPMADLLAAVRAYRAAWKGGATFSDGPLAIGPLWSAVVTALQEVDCV